jgi:hypothetical protein
LLLFPPGEIPTPTGISGVGVVTVAGYLLTQVDDGSSTASGSKARFACKDEEMESAVGAGGAALQSGSGAKSSNSADAGVQAASARAQPFFKTRVIPPNSSSSKSSSILSGQLDKRVTALPITAAAAGKGGQGNGMADSSGPSTPHSCSPDGVPGRADGAAAAAALLEDPSSDGKSKGTRGPGRYPHMRMAGAVHRAWQALDTPSMGPPLIVCVACIWSVTASLDKLGVAATPHESIWVYLLAQRLCIGCLSFTYLAGQSRSGELIQGFASNVWLLWCISLCDLMTVVAFLEGIANILVGTLPT